VRADLPTPVYTGSCYLGYTGSNCQIMFDTCAPAPCQTKASCVQPQAYLLACLSAPGPLCQNNMKDCTATSCLNGATWNMLNLQQIIIL
jgi:hypothetical protein